MLLVLGSLEFLLNRPQYAFLACIVYSPVHFPKALADFVTGMYTLNFEGVDWSFSLHLGESIDRA